MGNLSEEAIWHSGVRQLETGDPVAGGVPNINPGTEAGHSNIAPKQLADRTQWLKARVESNHLSTQRKDVMVLAAETTSRMKIELGRGFHEFGLTIRFMGMKIPSANPTVLRGFGGVSGEEAFVEPASALRVELKTDGKVQVTVFDETTASRVIESATSLVSTHGGKWVDLVLVRDDVGIKLYLNGELYLSEDHTDWLTPIDLGWAHFGFCSLNSWVGEVIGGGGVLNYAVPPSSTTVFVGIAERYSSGVFMQPEDYLGTSVPYETDFSVDSWNYSNAYVETSGGTLNFTGTNLASAYKGKPSTLKSGMNVRVNYTLSVACNIKLEGAANAPYLVGHGGSAGYSSGVLGLNTVIARTVSTSFSWIGVRLYTTGPAVMMDDFKIEALGAICYFPTIPGVGRQVHNVTPNIQPAILGSSGVRFAPPASSGKIIALNQDVSSGAYVLNDLSYLLPKNAVVSEVVVMGGPDYGGLYYSDLQERLQTLTYRNIRFASDGANGVRIQRADAAGTSYEALGLDIPVSEIDEANFSVEIHYRVLPDTFNGGDLSW